MDKVNDNPIKLPAIKTAVSSRVKEYLRVYSSSSLLSTRSDAFRPLKTREGESGQLAYISKNFSQNTKLEKQQLNQDIKRKEQLNYEISVAKSDKLEIIRDLSTYESELSNRLNLSNRLETLNASLGSLPEMFNQFQARSVDNQSIGHLISQGLNQFHNIEIPKVSYSLKTEEFAIREYNTLSKMKLLYTAIKSISGVRVVIRIKGDIFLENFLISIISSEGEACLNVPIKLDKLAVNTLNQPVEITAAIEEKITPHLYLIYCNRTLCLKFDENFPNEKNSVIFNLKNYGKTSVLV